MDKTAYDRRIANEISKKGMQGILNLYGKTAVNAMQEAIPITIRYLMIKDFGSRIYMSLLNAGISYAFNLLSDLWR